MTSLDTAGGAGSLVFVVLAARRRSPRLGWAGAGSAALTLLGLACVPTGLEFYWIVTDPIGFPVAMTNTPATPSQAKVIWRASYEPFGLATEELDPDGDGKQVRMPMRFPGQWWDYAANVHHSRFRSYDAATGRYLQPEPALQRPELVVESARQRFPLVTYGYAFSNPVHFIDPDGYGPRTAYHFFKNLFELKGWFGLQRAGNDKFHHCRANCEANKDWIQIEGQLHAVFLDALKEEVFDRARQCTGGSTGPDPEDWEANDFGLGADPSVDCTTYCAQRYPYYGP